MSVALLLLEELLVGLAEDLLLILLLALAVDLFLGLTLQLLLNLTVYQLSLQHIVLQALDVFHLEFVELVRDGLGVGDFAVVFGDQLILDLLVEGLHFGFVELLPLLLEALLVLQLPLLHLLLDVTLRQNIRHQQLRVERLHYVLLLLGELVSTFNDLHACVLLLV